MIKKLLVMILLLTSVVQAGKKKPRSINQFTERQKCLLIFRVFKKRKHALLRRKTFNAEAIQLLIDGYERLSERSLQDSQLDIYREARLCIAELKSILVPKPHQPTSATRRARMRAFSEQFVLEDISLDDIRNA